MQFNFYSIYDNKAKTFGTPFVMQNDDMAKRAFKTIVDKPDNDYHNHSDDFILYQIGTFEDGTASISQTDPIQNLGVASSFKEPKK